MPLRPIRRIDGAQRTPRPDGHSVDTRQSGSAVAMREIVHVISTYEAAMTPATATTDSRHSDPKYVEAKRHVAALKGLYIHAIVFACVMSILFAIDMIDKNPWWVHWLLIGWGIGLSIHGAIVLAPINLFSHAWEQRKIDEHMRKL
jgi:hypothetical protein